MPVDMVPARFFDELDRLEPFERRGLYDAAIQRAELPPKQAFLPGLFLFNHSAGYRLPAWKDFSKYYIAAVKKHKNFANFARCFTDKGEAKPGLLYRMSGWYEDSMAHAFLYAVLVLAYEDTDHIAFVLFDARSDWKFKADFVIVEGVAESTCAL